jgi:hypothetical protein
MAGRQATAGAIPFNSLSSRATAVTRAARPVDEDRYGASGNDPDDGRVVQVELLVARQRDGVLDACIHADPVRPA